jgi:hypothetical protein
MTTCPLADAIRFPGFAVWVQAPGQSDAALLFVIAESLSFLGASSPVHLVQRDTPPPVGS